MRNFFSSWFWLIAPVAVASVLYTANLSRLPLEDADEATYAMVLREMASGGHYLTPTLFGGPWSEKPPLLFWLMAAASKIFGFNEFSMRLPEAIFGVIAVLLTVGIIREFTRKKETAFIGGLSLAFMPLFLAAARNVRMDVPVTASILSAIYFFIKGRHRPVFLLGFGASLGMGIMFKNVIALLAIPLIVFFIFIYRDWRLVKNKCFWLGNLFGITIAAPWHIYEALFLGPAFFEKYLGVHVASRLTQNILTSRITSDYVLWVFWKYGQPWSLLFIIAIAAYLFFLIKKITAANVAERNSFLFSAFSLLAFVFLFGVFLFSETKLITYFIPSYPFLAVFLASVYHLAAGQPSKFLQQNIVRVVMGLALASGLFFSINEAFFNSRLYVSKDVIDSKQIGLYLASHFQEIPIYVYEYPSDQTIQYYSKRRVEHLAEESSNSLKPPFFLIIPTPLLKDNQWLGRFSHPYGGDYLTLVSVVE